MLLSKCPTCASESLDRKKIDHLIKCGDNVAFVEVEVEICHKCGETLFTPDQIKLFEDVEDRLLKNQMTGFVQVGKNFRFQQF